CFRFLKMNDLEAILDMTPSDYSYLMIGYRLKRLDDIQTEVEKEVLRNKLGATDKKGKPMYSFKQVYNHAKEVTNMMYDTRKSGVKIETLDKFKESMDRVHEAFNGKAF